MQGLFFSFYLINLLLIYFWLRWVFIAVGRLFSSCGKWGLLSSFSAWLLIAVASLVAQLVKNLPAVLETWVRPLGWEDPLEKGKTTHSSILAWRIPWMSPELDNDLATFTVSCCGAWALGMWAP